VGTDAAGESGEIGTELVRTIVLANENGDLVRDYLEAGVEVIFDTPLVERIPVIGTIYAVSKGVVSMPDRIFAHKLLRFVQGIGTPTDRDLAAWNERLGDQARRRKFGERLLVAIDAMNDAWTSSCSSGISPSALA
jgi:hypothetical protein